MTVIEGLGQDFNTPILITQHMPEKFTAILAEHLGKIANRESAEGVDGELIKPGRIYVAPGNFHMLVEHKGTQNFIRISATPAENYCRPSVDPMLRSMAPIFGKRLLTVILTGMGHDGLAGGEAVVEAGGTVLAQDETSSVVWGMPGAVATAGVCAAVMPLDKIAAHLRRVFGRA
jgi:two-component system chemotaxis response regulator CheB